MRQGETLLEIAGLYGISLDALLAVNPGVNPTVLSVGQELRIPDPEGGPIVALVPSPTPIPLALGPTRCYRRPTAGAWCLLSVHNPSTVDLENLLVEVEVTGPGETGVTQVAAPLLNLLPAGGVMPIAAALAESPAAGATVSARILSVLPALGLEERYRQPRIDVAGDRRQESGMSWLIEGTLTLPEDAPPVNLTRLLVTAFAAGDEVVGFAVWEPTSPLAPGEATAFRVRVFSLGPPIGRYTLIAESFAVVAPGDG